MLYIPDACVEEYVKLDIVVVTLLICAANDADRRLARAGCVSYSIVKFKLIANN